MRDKENCSCRPRAAIISRWLLVASCMSRLRRRFLTTPAFAGAGSEPKKHPDEISATSHPDKVVATLHRAGGVNSGHRVEIKTLFLRVKKRLFKHRNVFVDKKSR